MNYVPPSDLHLTNNPFDHITTCTIKLNTSHPTLGLNLQELSNYNHPQLLSCQKSTPAARIPRWCSELKHGFITHINTTPVHLIQQIKNVISKYLSDDQPPSKITFTIATINCQALQPELVIPQLYHDQMNIIAHHLWDLNNDPQYSKNAHNNITAMEALHTNVTPSNNSQKQSQHRLACNSIKKAQCLTCKILQQGNNWYLWLQVEHQQLNQYHNQQMFGAPILSPPKVNILNLIWSYALKDDGRYKA